MRSSIYEANYIKNGRIELVTVNNIEQHENFNDVRINLYCTYDGCHAKLSYVPKGKVRAHFKTWPKENHIEDCIDYFKREAKAKKQKTEATSTMTLSDKHIKSVLNNLKRKRKEQTLGINPRTQTRKKPRPKVDPKSGEKTVLNIVPTTGPDADLASGEGNIKEPPVRNRTLINLTTDDLGLVRSVEGYIQSVELNDKRSVLEIREGNVSLRVYFEEYFFNNSPVNFTDYFKSLQLLVNKKQDYLFSGVGLIESRNGDLAMVINRGNDFVIEYQYIALFLHKQSVLF